MQLRTTRRLTTTEDDYLAVINAKTAALFAAAAEVGGVISNRSRDELTALHSFGRNLGLAFQLTDDALDYSGNQAALGKTIGDDFREGKITLPVILAYRRANREERSFLERTLERNEQNDGDLEQAIGLIASYQAIDDAIARARHYGAIAIDALGIFPVSPVHVALADAVSFAINRSH
jgi:octaprenyl-diphosphate synthase